MTLLLFFIFFILILFDSFFILIIFYIILIISQVVWPQTGFKISSTGLTQERLVLKCPIWTAHTVKCFYGREWRNPVQLLCTPLKGKYSDCCVLLNIYRYCRMQFANNAGSFKTIYHMHCAINTQMLLNTPKYFFKKYNL